MLNVLLFVCMALVHVLLFNIVAFLARASARFSVTMMVQLVIAITMTTTVGIKSKNTIRIKCNWISVFEKLSLA